MTFQPSKDINIQRANEIRNFIKSKTIVSLFDSYGDYIAHKLYDEFMTDGGELYLDSTATLYKTLSDLLVKYGLLAFFEQNKTNILGVTQQDESSSQDGNSNDGLSVNPSQVLLAACNSKNACKEFKASLTVNRETRQTLIPKPDSDIPIIDDLMLLDGSRIDINRLHIGKSRLSDIDAENQNENIQQLKKVKLEQSENRFPVFLANYVYTYPIKFRNFLSKFAQPLIDFLRENKPGLTDAICIPTFKNNQLGMLIPITTWLTPNDASQIAETDFRDIVRNKISFILDILFSPVLPELYRYVINHIREVKKTYSEYERLIINSIDNFVKARLLALGYSQDEVNEIIGQSEEIFRPIIHEIVYRLLIDNNGYYENQAEVQRVISMLEKALFGNHELAEIGNVVASNSNQTGLLAKVTKLFELDYRIRLAILSLPEIIVSNGDIFASGEPSYSNTITDISYFLLKDVFKLERYRYSSDNGYTQLRLKISNANALERGYLNERDYLPIFNIHSPNIDELNNIHTFAYELITYNNYLKVFPINGKVVDFTYKVVDVLLINLKCDPVYSALILNHSKFRQVMKWFYRYLRATNQFYLSGISNGSQLDSSVSVEQFRNYNPARFDYEAWLIQNFLQDTSTILTDSVREKLVQGILDEFDEQTLKFVDNINNRFFQAAVYLTQKCASIIYLRIAKLPVELSDKSNNQSYWTPLIISYALPSLLLAF